MVQKEELCLRAPVSSRPFLPPTTDSVLLLLPPSPIAASLQPRCACPPCRSSRTASVTAVLTWPSSPSPSSPPPRSKASSASHRRKRNDTSLGACAARPRRRRPRATSRTAAGPRPRERQRRRQNLPLGALAERGDYLVPVRDDEAKLRRAPPRRRLDRDPTALDRPKRAG